MRSTGLPSSASQKRSSAASSTTLEARGARLAQTGYCAAVAARLRAG
jgi:hypothetical protein